MSPIKVQHVMPNLAHVMHFAYVMLHNVTKSRLIVSTKFITAEFPEIISVGQVRTCTTNMH